MGVHVHMHLGVHGAVPRDLQGWCGIDGNGKGVDAAVHVQMVTGGDPDSTCHNEWATLLALTNQGPAWRHSLLTVLGGGKAMRACLAQVVKNLSACTMHALQ